MKRLALVVCCCCAGLSACKKDEPAAPQALKVERLLPTPKPPGKVRPDPSRVLLRGRALCALTGRSIREQHDDLRDVPPYAELSIELSANEKRLLAMKPGTWSQADVAYWSWGSESVGVLAWALGRAELAAPETQFNAVDVCDAMVKSEAPELKAVEALTAYRDLALYVHWRVTAWDADHTPTDFQKLAGKLDGLKFAESDLAIDGVPIAKANEGALQRVRDIAVERHHAINWLLGGAPEWEDVDTSAL